MPKNKKNKKIPEATIRRLGIYIQVLKKLKEKDVLDVSSEILGLESGYSASQIRKDISYFGECGIAGKGYDLNILYSYIQQVLGIEQGWNVALVGIGHLGMALLSYPGFKERGFNIIAAFDNDPLKTGKTLKNIKIKDISQLKSIVKKKNIQIAIAAVPAPAAQKIVNSIVEAGIKAILNFAPVVLTVPEGVKLQNADLSLEFGILSYFLTNPHSLR
ncbi:MAG: redox-sensing transcriptional repressor Rex [Candidatus Omnitrophica bacterium]|nr:redox-sensing transcriptional repressor Rex [Candidatus Omnitrophota bacterium]